MEIHTNMLQLSWPVLHSFKQILSITRLEVRRVFSMGGGGCTDGRKVWEGEWGALDL